MVDRRLGGRKDESRSRGIAGRGGCVRDRARATAVFSRGWGVPADDASFENFVADCADRLLLSAVLLVGGDWAAGEDLLQGAFERTYRQWGRMNDPKPEAYVRRALVNAATSRWRTLRTRVGEVP